ncbi:MAG: addiction module protein [Deltaproteobacteria bacterium]|nr:addiction module protein [Deltaproteobacteria bacterium]
MELALPLDQMTTAEKLRALEQIWEDLCRTPDEVPSPSWHADVLQGREERIRKGSSQFVDWAEAKRQIRDSTK